MKTRKILEVSSTNSDQDEPVSEQDDSDVDFKPSRNKRLKKLSHKGGGVKQEDSKSQKRIKRLKDEKNGYELVPVKNERKLVKLEREKK